MSGHQFPTGYPPVAYCRACGRDFSGDTMFDRHRVGSHEYDWSLAHEDGRRCLDEEEMLEKGWRPMTKDEMLAGRHRRRADFDIELWFSPAETERLRHAKAHLRSSSNAVEATEG